MRRADNFTAIVCQLFTNSERLNLLEPKGPVQPCIGIAVSTTTALLKDMIMFMFCIRLQHRKISCTDVN